MLLPIFTAIQGTVFVSISDVIFDPRLIEALVNVIKILLRWVETFGNCYLTRPVTYLCLLFEERLQVTTVPRVTTTFVSGCSSQFSALH